MRKEIKYGEKEARWLGERNRFFYEDVCKLAKENKANVILTSSKNSSIFEMLPEFRYTSIKNKKLENINGFKVVRVGEILGNLDEWTIKDNKPYKQFEKFIIYNYCGYTDKEPLRLISEGQDFEIDVIYMEQNEES